MQSIIVHPDLSAPRPQAKRGHRRAQGVRAFGESSATYQSRADQCLHESEAHSLPQLRQRALIAGERWQQLANQARRVEERATTITRADASPVEAEDIVPETMTAAQRPSGHSNMPGV